MKIDDINTATQEGGFSTTARSQESIVSEDLGVAIETLIQRLRDHKTVDENNSIR